MKNWKTGDTLIAKNSFAKVIASDLSGEQNMPTTRMCAVRLPLVAILVLPWLKSRRGLLIHFRSTKGMIKNLPLI